MKKILSIALVVILAVGMLAGCGKKDTTIKIGILGCHTGDAAQYGLAVLNGAQLYIDKVNADGGINGKQIEPIIYDDKGDTTEAVNAFTRMVDNDKITALLGSVLTDPTLAVVREAYPIGMPMITASATAAEVTYDNGTLYSNVFRTCFIDPFQGEKMAQYASEVLGATTAAVIYQTGNNYAEGLKDAFVAKAESLGITIVSEEGYSKGDKAFQSQLTNINSKGGADVIFCPNYYEDDSLIVTQARQVGLDSGFMGGDGWAGVADYATAEDLEGSVYCSAYAASSTDEIKAFETAYTEKYGDDTLNMFAPLGYDAAVVLIDAIKAAEGKGLDTGSDEYKAAVIDAMKNTSAVGITSTYKFDEYNNPIKAAVIIKIENGSENFSQMF